MVGRLARPAVRPGMSKPEFLEVERINISIDRPHRVIRPDVIVKARRKKAGLVPVHPSLERSIRHPQSLRRTPPGNRVNSCPVSALNPGYESRILVRLSVDP